MADLQVTCVNKQPLNNTHEGITHLGGPGGNGWRWTRQQVIDSINAGTNTFYTLEAGRWANIAVIDGPYCDFLRTHADGEWTDDLLVLQECPV